MGRNRVPPEIARLKGNPRKARLDRGADEPAPAAPSGQPVLAAGEVLAPESTAGVFEVPEFLAGDLEREIFRRIVEEFLPRNLVQSTDFNNLGRYATLMQEWIKAKREFDESGGGRFYKVESKHGSRFATHPALRLMLELNNELRQMEPHLGLTPLSRQLIMTKLQNIAPLPPGGMFERTMPAEGAPEEPEVSPLGYMQTAGSA
jgi:P27 family predicted phage terminase small subunit